jgi:hypothetical protein
VQAIYYLRLWKFRCRNEYSSEIPRTTTNTSAAISQQSSSSFAQAPSRALPVSPSVNPIRMLRGSSQSHHLFVPSPAPAMASALAAAATKGPEALQGAGGAGGTGAGAGPGGGTARALVQNKASSHSQASATTQGPLVATPATIKGPPQSGPAFTIGSPKMSSVRRLPCVLPKAIKLGSNAGRK